MPSAEAQPDAQVSASYSQFGNTVAAQLHLPAPAAGVGDAALLDDQRLGQRARIPDYNLFDRSLDVQFQLLKEKGWQPSVALGFRDVLGTGVYSGEYLVATKTIARDFTVTGGIGWGGSPASAASRTRSARSSDSFCTREIDFGEGGNVDLRRDVPRRERWASSAASSGGRRSTS